MTLFVCEAHYCHAGMFYFIILLPKKFKYEFIYHHGVSSSGRCGQIEQGPMQSLIMAMACHTKCKPTTIPDRGTAEMEFEPMMELNTCWRPCNYGEISNEYTYELSR